MTRLIGRLFRDEDGQDLVEYVLLVALIALAVATAFPPLAEAITGVFTAVEGQLPAGGGGAP